MIINNTQVQVDVKKDTPINLRTTIFHFTCHGGSENQQSKLFLRQGQVNRQMAELCTEKNIRVAYNQQPFKKDPGWFELDVENNNKMVEFPGIGKAQPYQILTTFLKSQKLTPTWIDCNSVWANFDDETGLWSGILGQVSRLCLAFSRTRID